MPATDTSEQGLEALIVAAMVQDGGYVEGDPGGYDRDHAVDWPHLLAFLQATQPRVVEGAGLGEDGPRRATRGRHYWSLLLTVA